MATTLTTNALGTGTRGTVFVVFGGEIGALLVDMRWALVMLILLIIADFRFGWGESARRYKQAVRDGDKVLMGQYRWHISRAVRRTLNKLADYIVMMLLFSGIGMAVFEPVGIDHTWGAWVGAVIACGCELSSIFGHFFYLRGVEVEKRTVSGFLKALLVAIVKKKDAEVGEAVEEVMKSEERVTNYEC